MSTHNKPAPGEKTEPGAELLRCSEGKYQDMVHHSREVVFELDAAGRWSFLNPAWRASTGFAVEESLGRPYLDFISPDDLARIREWLEPLLQGEPLEVCEELRLLTRDGGYRWFEFAARPAAATAGGAVVVRGSLTDIHHRKLSELLEADRNQVLAMIARNQPLTDILTQLVELVDHQRRGMAGAILLLRHDRPYHAVSPGLPHGFTRAVDNNPLLSENDFFSLAVLSGELVISDDIATDERWRPNRELALAHGLRACWAMPLRSGQGAALGSFVVYSTTPRPPAAVDLELLATASRLASIAVEHRQMADQLAFPGQHDALTGLPNRVLLADRLEQALMYARRHGQTAAVLYIDLDRFNEVNDSYSHAVGDLLLKQVAHRMLGGVRHYDTLARMGGDEFTMVLTDLKGLQSALRVAQNLNASLALPFIVEGHELFITASIGISIFPRDGEDAASLLRHADVAMYRAKSQGKNNCQFFAPEMNDASTARMEMENLLRRAVQQERLELHYQPVVRLDGALTGFEALVRMHHPESGLVPPAEFIPIAEESGLIVAIGTWVLEQACRQNAAWQQAGLTPLTMAVNVSALQFARPDFVGLVASALHCNGLDAQWLALELTESLLFVNSQDAMDKLTALRALGVGLVIDDFGTGYSSLAYLQRLPITRLKIDRAFIVEVDNPSGKVLRAQALVQTIIGLAHSLEIEVVAEGVETRAQLDFLQRAGCDRAQGYFFRPPMPALEAENYIKTAPRLN